MSKFKPKNKEEYLAKKREQAKLWYQNIKNNPELYAEYQRKNRQKYEKRLARKKVVPISEMTSTQQRQQRKKWREESKRRYQRKKGKKEKDKQSGAENSSPEDDSYPVHLIETILLPNPEITEEDFTIKADCQDLINQDIEDNPEFNLDYQSRQENNTMHEHIPTIEITSGQQKNQSEKIDGRKGRLEPDKDKIENLKPENTAEVLTIKMVSEGLSYQSINDNPDSNFSDIENHERKKAQDKNVSSIEITSYQHQIQRETLRDEGQFNNEEVFSIKTESKDLNYNTEFNMDYQAQYERNKEQEKITPIIEMPSSQQKMQRQNLREEGKKRCQAKKDKKEKRKLRTREEILAKKRERERLRYHHITSNPELHAEYQRKQNANYKNRKAQKKNFLITDMTPRQQKKQREKWRAESRKRYQKIKERKEREKHSVGENKKACLTKKREQARLWYLNIKNNPELYAEYQKKNRLKYEKRLARRKVVPISEMTSAQQRKQRKKWREESKRKYQRMKGKKERDKQSGTENSSPEDDSYPVHLIETIILPNPENTEDFTIETDSQDLINQDIEDNPELNSDYQSRHENITMREHIPTIEITSCQQKNQMNEPDIDKNENLKHEIIEEVFTIKMESEDLSYQSINDNQLNLSDIRSYERKKAQVKNDPSIEITSCQNQMQKETLRDDEREVNSEEDFSIKAECEELNSELSFDYQSQYERNKEHENNTPTKEMSSSQQIMQRKSLREEGKTCRPKKDKKEKRKQSREELLAKKRERERLRYHYIKNNPELYSEYQRKQNTNYEQRKAQKKILPINEMTPRQQKEQREKWRLESKKRYQRVKEKKEREKQLGAENSSLEDDSYPVQLLVVKKTIAVNVDL